MTNPSLEEITTAMTEAVEMDGSLKKKFNAVVSFDVEGESFRLDARKESGEPKEKADLEVKTSLPVLQELLAKKITPQQAFMKGKLKIKGKMGLAMKLKLILDATRKHLALQTSRL